MNRHTKFLRFLEAICDENALYTTIKHGYYTCMESIMTNVGGNTWEFDSENLPLEFSKEIATKYMNLEKILKDNKLPSATDDIRVSIKGNAELIDGKVQTINDLLLTLKINDTEYGTVNITIPSVLTPSDERTDADSMLATSVNKLLEDLPRYNTPAPANPSEQFPTDDLQVTEDEQSLT